MSSLSRSIVRASMRDQGAPSKAKQIKQYRKKRARQEREKVRKENAKSVTTPTELQGLLDNTAR